MLIYPDDRVLVANMNNLEDWRLVLQIRVRTVPAQAPADYLRKVATDQFHSYHR